MHDPNRVILRRACRIAVILPATYAFVQYVVGDTGGSLYAAFGTFSLLVLTDFGGPTQVRSVAYVTTSVIAAVGIVLGSLAASTRVSAVAATFVFVFLVDFAGVLRGYVGVAASAVILPFVIAVTSGPATVALVLERVEAYAIAAVVSVLAAALLWPVRAREPIRRKLADACDAAAATARLMVAAAEQHESQQVREERFKAGYARLLQAKDAVHQAYDGNLLRPGGYTDRDRALAQLIDELSRLCGALRWRANDPRTIGEVDLSLARASTETLAAGAAALRHEGPPPDSVRLCRERERHRLATEELAGANLAAGDTDVALDVMDRGFQVRFVSMIVLFMTQDIRTAVGAKQQPEARALVAGVEFVRESWQRSRFAVLGDQFSYSSPWFRNSARAAAALSLAVLVASMTGVQHGFWVVLGALTALRFNALDTGRTAAQALLGTVGGFVVGSVIVWMFGANQPVLWILLPVSAFLAAYTPGVISLTVGQGSFTVFVIVLFGLIEPNGIKTGEIRVVDVSLGLAMSLLASALLWPRGVTAQLRSTLAVAMHSASEYLLTSYDRLIEGPVADEDVTRAGLRATRDVGIAQETFDLALAQPGPAAVPMDAWAAVANSASRLMGSADVVVYMAQANLTPSLCPGVNDTMIAAAHHVRARFNAAIDRVDRLARAVELVDEVPSPDPAAATLDDDPVSRLNRKVRDCLRGFSGVTEAGLGHEALTLVWAQEWLQHLDWLSRRLEKRLATAA